MDLRSDHPYWLLKSGLIANYPSFTKDKNTEIVVMGAGISGALVAWHLCKKGFQVVVVDKRHSGTGSTAASTALLQYEIDTPLHTLIERVGEKNAARSYLLCIKAIYDLEKICNGLKAEVGFEMKNSFQYASFKKDVAELRLEYSLRRKHGIDLHWLAEKDIKNKFGFSAPGGLFSRDGAQVDAYRLTHALLDQALGWGLKVYNTTEVTHIHHRHNNVVLSTHSGCKITANHLVIACGYESQKYIPKKVEELNSTYAIASEPLGARNMWYKNCLIWETATPYLYMRTTADNRILVGGKDDLFYNPPSGMRISLKKPKHWKSHSLNSFHNFPS